MKNAIFYAAANPNGSSAQIVNKITENIPNVFSTYNILDKSININWGSIEHIVFIVATYGDQELQDDAENFISGIKHDLKSISYSLCEIGNYYGYDDFKYGSGDIVEKVFQNLGAIQKTKTVSIDTLPKIDWQGVEHWTKLLSNAVKA